MRTLQTVFLSTCHLRLCESRSAGVSHMGGLCVFPLSSASLSGPFRTEEGSMVGNSPFPLCDSGHLAAHPGGCPIPPTLTLASVWDIPARLPGTCLGIRISENCSIVFVGLQASTVGEACCPPKCLWGARSWAWPGVARVPGRRPSPSLAHSSLGSSDFSDLPS